MSELAAKGERILWAFQAFNLAVGLWVLFNWGLVLEPWPTWVHPYLPYVAGVCGFITWASFAHASGLIYQRIRKPT